MGTRLISEILNISQPSLFHQIEELERKAGRPGLDIKLTGELKLIYKEKARALGLDEHDTTIEELYFAARNQALYDSRQLAKTIGINEDDSPKKAVEKSIKFVEKRIGKKTVWSLKRSVARRQLKENPPKKLMRILGVKSIQSALKRERISLFYCFAPLAEPPAWLNRYADQTKKVSNSDFDIKQISIHLLADKRRKKFSEANVKLSRVLYCHPELGAIEIAVPEKRFNGDVLFFVDSLLLQIKNMLKLSAYYKSQSFKLGFVSKLAKDRVKLYPFADYEEHPFGWSNLHYAATQLGLPELLQRHEPTISAEELMLPSLPQLAGLNFWQHPFGTYKHKDIIISFNLSDMIINAVNDYLPQQAYVEHGRTNLKNELFARYLSHEPVRLAAIEFSDEQDK